MDWTAWCEGGCRRGVRRNVCLALPGAYIPVKNVGGWVNVSTYGRKDYDQARSYAAGSLQLTALSGILFAAVCVIFIQPLLGFLI